MPKGDGLTLRQRKWLAAYIETGNATEAARVAGYSEKSAEAIGFQNLRKLQPPLDDLMDRMGLTDARLMHVLQEGLAAEAVVTATEHGVITDERTYVDHGARHAYLTTALKLKGRFARAEVGAAMEALGDAGNRARARLAALAERAADTDSLPDAD